MSATGGRTGPEDSSPLDHDIVELATAHQVATEYWDWQGAHVTVPRATVVAVLGALGVDASTPGSVRAALEDRRLAPWRRTLPASVVTRSGWTPWVRLHVRHGDPVDVWVALEGGGLRHDVSPQDVYVEPRMVDGVLVGEATVAIPGDLPTGWHRLHARHPGGESSCPLVVTPARLTLPDPLRSGRLWGFAAQLYAARSRRSWGIGDLADLAELAGWSGRELGAGFVLVNPLHAAEPTAPMEPSPYLPTTRRFVNPLYLRVEDVSELAYLGGTARSEVERLAAGRRVANGTSERLDRDATWEAKRTALTALHTVPRGPGRESAYRAFLVREGEGLRDFATWCALSERHGQVWREWPAELRDPQSPAVAVARQALADRVDFYCWLQFLLDEQLAAAHRTAREAGMPVGVVHDLAVGVHPEGADAWGLGDALAQGITVGAPADAFNQQGQDWSQPPWRPDRLAELGYAPYRDMLRGVLRHAGGVRVDHVIGLFRLWWVPEGMPASAGTYVRYDHEALVGILSLEAERAGAFVVGEDLGTVEPWVRDYLAERGLLGTSILWFEKDSAGRPLRPERWRSLCLASVTTHDLPPTAGYLDGVHIALRAELGLLTRDVYEERAVDEADRAAWVGMLGDLGLLRPDASVPEVVEALHRLLTWSPARLLGVSLSDAAGDRQVINQPGTSDEYPNWRLPLCDRDGRPVLLEDLATAPLPRALARAVSWHG